MATPWKINIDGPSLGGFAPLWFNETYPSYGNKNQAGAMQNVDLTNAGFLTQGPGATALTNGTQAGAVTTLIKSILDRAVTSDATYGIGGNLLHKITSATVVDDATWPHTIDKAAVTAEDGEDGVLYQGNLYYLYNHSGSAGDIGKYNLDATFDDDWGSTVPTGMAALTNNPHPAALGGNDTFAFGNGAAVGAYDGTTLDTTALDLPTNTVVVDIKWSQDRWWITANYTNLTGANKNPASVFIWDGVSESWEDEIPLGGTAGGSHIKNGALLQFYRDIRSTGGYKLGQISGGGVTDLATYDGELPNFGQITDFKDFVMWLSDDDVFAFGSGNSELPVRLFQYASTTHGEGGALANPFGTLLGASWDASTSYNLAKFSDYTVTSSWKSLVFDVTGQGKSSHIDTIRINFEQLAANARVDWKLLDNQGRTVYSDIISNTKLGAVTTAWYNLNGKIAENFRLEFDFTNGNTTNPVKIKNARIHGRTE